MLFQRSQWPSSVHPWVRPETLQREQHIIKCGIYSVYSGTLFYLLNRVPFLGPLSSVLMSFGWWFMWLSCNFPMGLIKCSIYFLLYLPVAFQKVYPCFNMLGVLLSWSNCWWGPVRPSETAYVITEQIHTSPVTRGGKTKMNWTWKETK